MKLTTAGESHGKGLFAIYEGLPSNLKIDIDEINHYLNLRQSGYGRGGRQKIESDTVEILSGVRNTYTLGSPVAICVKNSDYKNWQQFMAPEGCDTTQKTLTKVRPGHADLTGLIKYDQTDARNILERASARETAVRVAAGTIARQYLRALGIEISGYVKSVCGVIDPTVYAFESLNSAKSEPLFMLDKDKQQKAMALIDQLKQNGDTAGGIIEIRVKGLKSGFGSCMQYDKKLDARLAFALMSVQAIKGVEVGVGMQAGNLKGSQVHDEIYFNNGKFVRKSNNAGGIEGGMSNGEEIILSASMKPIPTLMKGLNTVDYISKQPCKAASERSDVAAICAAEIVLESVTAIALAEVVAERLGGDNMAEVIARYCNLA
ncbi:MAG: chorismate synthase [Clostridiales bacterium]|nr:chorismate synthase [Clostridiales bacterium]